MTLRVALVTGGSGFIGQHVIRAMVRRGWRVRGMARSRVAAERVASAGGVPAGADLLDPPSELRSLATGAEVVIHLAALVDPRLARDPAGCERVNLRGTGDLLAACSAVGSPRFIFISSVAAMGIRHLGTLATEATPCLPDTPYGRTKLCAEGLVEAYPGEGVSVRPPTVYGPGERYNFLSLTRAVASRTFGVIGGGSNRTSVCAAANLAEAVALLAEAPRCGPCYLVDDGGPTSWSDLARAIGSSLGRSPAWKPPRIPLWAARVAGATLGALLPPLGLSPPISLARVKTLSADFAFDTARLGQDTGYVPIVGTSEAIEETVGWYRREGLLR